MINFIMQNAGTIVVSMLLLVAAFFSVRKILKNRKSSGCMGCPQSASCGGAQSCPSSSDDDNSKK